MYNEDGTVSIEGRKSKLHPYIIDGSKVFKLPRGISKDQLPEHFLEQTKPPESLHDFVSAVNQGFTAKKLQRDFPVFCKKYPAFVNVLTRDDPKKVLKKLRRMKTESMKKFKADHPLEPETNHTPKPRPPKAPKLTPVEADLKKLPPLELDL